MLRALGLLRLEASRHPFAQNYIGLLDDITRINDAIAAPKSGYSGIGSCHRFIKYGNSQLFGDAQFYQCRK
jgi:hypothetical protein